YLPPAARDNFDQSARPRAILHNSGCAAGFSRRPQIIAITTGNRVSFNRGPVHREPGNGVAGEKGAEGPPAGDAQAFAELYAKLGGPIYRYLVRLIGRGGEAEDLFQETWAKVLEHREQLRDAKLFTFWIFRIARNLAFNEMRKGRRK